MADITRIFFSWQSDIEERDTKFFILDALDRAVKDVSKDPELELGPLVDRDTQGVAGAVNIRDVVFAKIKAASIFVADVTIIGIAGDRHCPNPNVCTEVGLAIEAVGWDNIILVINESYGDIEDLPFDFRGQRVLPYKLAAGATTEERSKVRAKLREHLGDAIKTIIKAGTIMPKRYPAELKLTCGRDIDSVDPKNFALMVSLKNNGKATITNWHVDVLVPKVVVRPHLQQSLRRAFESTATYDLFRIDPSHSALNKQFRPKGTDVHTIRCYMTRAIYESTSLDDQLITAEAYMNDDLVGEAKLSFGQWQNLEPVLAEGS